MLTVHEMQVHLGRLSYKPGWNFEIYEGDWEGPHIKITMTLPDSAGEGTVTLGVPSALPPMRSLDDLERWIGWRLAIIEVHEMREFLKRDGQVIFDPHAPEAHDDRPDPVR